MATKEDHCTKKINNDFELLLRFWKLNFLAFSNRNAKLCPWQFYYELSILRASTKSYSQQQDEFSLSQVPMSHRSFLEFGVVFCIIPFLWVGLPTLLTC